MSSPTMYEMAEDYRRSVDLMRTRMSELRFGIKHSEDPIDRMALERRLHSLNRMYTDLLSVTKIIENYYERGFYRDGKYCVTGYKSERRSFSGLVKTNRRNERRPNSSAEKEPENSNRAGSDIPPAADVVDVLFRQQKNGRNRGRSRRK